MSLRTQIHDAIDEIAPRAPALEGRVTDFVFAEARARRSHRSRSVGPLWALRFRRVTALVAAALVLVLVSGLFVAGRIWRDLNAPPPSINQAALKSLESRPLQLSALAPEAACPATPPTLNPKYGMVTGAGPVYLADLEVFEQTNWGFWVSLRFVYDESAPGLVLVRAIDLKGEGQVAFAQYPLAPTGVTAAGPTLGRDRAVNHDLLLRSEAVFSDSAHTPPINVQGKRPELLVLAGIQRGGTSCAGFQFDGPTASGRGFTETFVL